MPYTKNPIKSAEKFIVRKAKQRYTTGKGGLRMGKIMKDVSMLKGMLNPELKEFKIFNDPATDDGIDIGQVAGNSAGFYTFDASCIPAQGTTSTTRNGNSIRNHSLDCRFQVFQQANTVQDIYGKIIFVQPKIPTSDTNVFSTTIFDPNPFLNVSIIDYHSLRSEDHKKQYKILKVKKFRLKNDSYSGIEQNLSFSCNIKFKNHHTTFSTDGSQTLSGGQIYMLVLLDSGNSANSTASTVKNIVPSGGGVQTGLTFNYNLIHKYYDN